MLEGRLLNDRYKIETTIGGGGMANVYLAKDIFLDRVVAIKVLRLEYANDEEFITRFDREAKATTSLLHPNIVNIFDVGEEGNILYMVMEFVEGMTLKEYIQRFGPIEVEEAINIMKQVTSAIAHAHANNLVHRDIKPQNILMDRYGNAKVTDFGIAIALSATSLTQTNSILGSVHYLSPEQARGGMATKKSDVYSLGIVFYELLTGKLPFSGESPVSIALKHLQSDIPSVRKSNPKIPQSVENIVLKATAKDPFNRYQTIYELESALESALHPTNKDMSVFKPPVEPGDQTKIIPIIDNDYSNQETITGRTTIRKASINKTSKKNRKPYKSKKKQRKKKRKTWIIPLIILLIVTGIILSFIFIPGLLQPKEVIINDLIELEYEVAKEELELQNLMVEKELVYHDTIDENYIVKTNPKAGRKIKTETTVTLFVSQGKEKVEFNNYVGRDFSQIKKLLDNQGYKGVVDWQKPSDQPVGEIIKQVEPETGKQIIPDETQVIFEVSTGPELIPLINLKGMNEEEVTSYLDSKGLKLNKSMDYSNSVPVGQVITHDPSVNVELEQGSTVDIVFSNGPKADPPGLHSVTFTVPYIEPEKTETEPEENNESDVEDNIQNEEENEEIKANEKNEENEEIDGENLTEEPVKQKVLIYIGDMKYNIDEVFKEDYITEDTEYTITLTIKPYSDATYKVTRDGELIKEETKSY